MQVNTQWQKTPVTKTYKNIIENKLGDFSVIQGFWELLNVNTHRVGHNISDFILKYICFCFIEHSLGNDK